MQIRKKVRLGLANYLIIAVIVLGTFVCNDVNAKREVVPKGYLFGFSGSFTDSTVYFTPIQEVDSVWMDSKTKFLLGRDNYAYQMKTFFSDTYGEPYRTCIVFFAWEKKKIDKKFAKMKARYTTKAKSPYDVIFLDADDFTFRTVDMSMEEYSEDEAEKKAKKTKRRRSESQGMGTPPDGGQGGPPSGGGGMGGPM